MVDSKRLFFDTNFWLRYFVRDNEEQYQSSYKIIEAVENGTCLPFTSAIVFLEINYVLSSFYKLKSDKINKYFDLIINLRNLTIINKTNLDKSLKMHNKYHIKLSDCLIATSVPKNTLLISWDKDFKKVSEVNNIIPENFIKNNL